MKIIRLNPNHVTTTAPAVNLIPKTVALAISCAMSEVSMAADVDCMATGAVKGVSSTVTNMGLIYTACIGGSSDAVPVLMGNNVNLFAKTTPWSGLTAASLTPIPPTPSVDLGAITSTLVANVGTSIPDISTCQAATYASDTILSAPISNWYCLKATGSISTGYMWAYWCGFKKVNTIATSCDFTSPTVTVEQAAGQADPVNTGPILFTATFSEAVTGFDGADVTLGGTAGATTAAVTGSGTTYTIAVSGMTGTGTVTASINAAGATDAAGNGNTASTSTDNSVQYAPVSTLALLQNTWTLIGVPYNTGSNTLADVFGDDITTTYPNNWQLYRRNEATKTYVQLNATDTLTQGNGYWILSDTAATLDTTGTDTLVTTTGNCIPANGFANGCVAIPLTFSGSKQYNLLSHPFPAQVSWENVRFEVTTGATLNNCTAGTTGGTYLCTPSQAELDNVASKIMWQYNGSTFQPKDDVTAGMIGTLMPMEGFWVKALATGVTLLIPKP